MTPLDPKRLAALAAEAPDLPAFAGEVLDRCARVVGFDVAYFGAVGGAGEAPAFAAVRGFRPAAAARMIARAAVYTSELMPVKDAARANGGVAIDSDVFAERERARLAYFREAMAPDGGRHALFMLGPFGGSEVSVTMLGRTGSRFTSRDVDLLRGIGPVLGLATAAHRTARSSSIELSSRERELATYVSLGYTNAQIGLALGRSPRTVRNQLSALYARAGVANRAELVASIRPA